MKNEQLNQDAFNALFSTKLGQNEHEELEAVAEFENEPVTYQEEPTINTTKLIKVL